MNGIFALMAAHVDDRFAPPGAEGARWVVEGQRALMDWDGYTQMYTRPSPVYFGKEELVILAPPPLLSLIEQLHAEGWKRGGWHGPGWHGWRIYAYLRDGDAEIRVSGGVSDTEAGDRDRMHAFFGPPPPPVSRRKSFKAEFEEWSRKNREDEW